MYYAKANTKTQSVQTNDVPLLTERERNLLLFMRKHHITDAELPQLLQTLHDYGRNDDSDDDVVIVGESYNINLDETAVTKLVAQSQRNKNIINKVCANVTSIVSGDCGKKDKTTNDDNCNEINNNDGFTYTIRKVLKKLIDDGEIILRKPIQLKSTEINTDISGNIEPLVVRNYVQSCVADKEYDLSYQHEVNQNRQIHHDNFNQQLEQSDLRATETIYHSHAHNLQHSCCLYSNQCPSLQASRGTQYPLQDPHVSMYSSAPNRQFRTNRSFDSNNIIQVPKSTRRGRPRRNSTCVSTNTRMPLRYSHPEMINPHQSYTDFNRMHQMNNETRRWYQNSAI